MVSRENVVGMRVGSLLIELLKYVRGNRVRCDRYGIIGKVTGLRAEPTLSTPDIAAVRRCTFAAPRGLRFFCFFGKSGVWGRLLTIS